MQIVSSGDNLHKTANPVFWKNMKNIWSAEFAQSVEKINQHLRLVQIIHACVSPAGDLISSTADDGTLRVWDTITGAELVTVTSLPLPVWPEKHETIQLMLHPVNPSCFSRTGDVIANGTEHGEVMLLDVSGVQVSFIFKCFTLMFHR